MTTFHENKILTTEGNFKELIGIAKVGDRYISGTSTYTRVDIRKNKGVAWVLVKNTIRNGPCKYEYDNGTGHTQCSIEHDNCVSYTLCRCYRLKMERIIMNKEHRCYECKHKVVNFDNILDDVNEENILCESCDEIISYHPGCTIVPRSE